ncbi:MAG: putative rRNA maturation factor [Gammaproteobacteria bacterium]|jgi:probable rRNA maturation factor|nr:putative rRNA maturation factor [Gammaproteobacteria bacterium]
MARRLELDVGYAARQPWVPGSRQLNRWATAALVPLRRSVVLSVRIVGKARSRSLNAHYRHKDKPTNVLSFSGAGSAPDGRYFLGELVICAPVVAQEAQTQGKALQAHWAHMTVHGVLHLLGFDHELALEAAKMAAKEIQILDRLGFSDPYR